MHKENLIEILQGIDEEAALLLGVSSSKARVILVGGAAFMLRDLTTRQLRMTSMSSAPMPSSEASLRTTPRSMAESLLLPTRFPTTSRTDSFVST